MIFTRHPDIIGLDLDWARWRDAYDGGRWFVENYLEKYSQRENPEEYAKRKKISYCPAFAKAAIDEIGNAVFQRLADVSRIGGPASYQAAVRGLDGGVDQTGSTMASFIGSCILRELLPMGKVGVWVDRDKVSVKTTLGSNIAPPYLYYYRIEDILSWTTFNDGSLKSILLRDWDYQLDTEGFPTGWSEVQRRVWISDDGKVHVKVGDGVEEVLKIKRIPFICGDIGQALMKDVADYQVALLQLASSDINYAYRSNFPFYVEEYDPRTSSPHLRPAQKGANTAAETGIVTPAGQAKEAGQGKTDEVKVGTGHGRRYQMGTKTPSFIHPSAEPLRVSMEKQLQMKAEIRQLVHLAVTNLDPKLASAESKSMDNVGLQNGLSAIGLVLEKMERQIAEIWAAYEDQEPAIIRYPEVWSMQTDEERRNDAIALAELMDAVPSRTFNREVGKQVAAKLVGHKVAPDVMDKIGEEIDNAQGMTANGEEIRADVERGLLTAKRGAVIRGYPEEEAEKALEEQAKRLSIIAISQGQGMGAARGVPTDQATGDQNQAPDEKKVSKISASSTSDSSKQRGDGK